jgi:hypothetical protein
MYVFMSDQVLGINGLINLSNIVFLGAFSVRDVLKLRILAIIGEGLTLPYYHFQDRKTMTADCAGGGIHDRQRDPHRCDSFGAATGSFQRPGRKALSRRIQLDRPAGVLEARQPCPVDRMFTRGGYSQKGSIHIGGGIVVIAGDLEAVLSSNCRMTLGPGQLIGNVSAYSGLASPAVVVARGPETLAKWDLQYLREFTG